MKKFLFLVLFALVISLATLAAFCGGKQVCMMMSGQSVLMSEKEADGPFLKEANALCMDICRERMNLMNLLGDKTARPEFIHKKVEEIGLMQTALERKIADHILAMRNRLSGEESQAYLKKIRANFEKSMQQCGFSL